MNPKAEMRLRELCEEYSLAIRIDEDGSIDFDSFFQVSASLRGFIQRNFQSDDDPMGAGELIYQLTSNFIAIIKGELAHSSLDKTTRLSLADFIHGFLKRESHSILVTVALPETVDVNVEPEKPIHIDDTCMLFLAEPTETLFGSRQHLRLQFTFKDYYNGSTSGAFSLQVQTFLKFLIQFGFITEIFDTVDRQQQIKSLPLISVDGTSANVKTRILRALVQFPNTPDVNLSDIPFDLDFSHHFFNLKWHDSVAGLGTLQEQHEYVKMWLSLALMLYRQRETKVSAKRIVASCSWLYDSYSHHNETTGYIHACIALEALLGDQGGGLTNLLSERVSYLLGGDYEDRERISKEVKELYKLRSQIVHGTAPNLSRQASQSLYRLRRIVNKVILSELTATLKSLK